MRLNFAQKFQVAGALAEMIEQDGEYVKYKDHTTEAEAARAISERLGFEVSTSLLAGVRTEIHGKIRQFRPAAETSAEIEQLRNVVAGLATKVENLRKIIEHFDLAQHNRRGEIAARIREIVGRNRVDERTVRTQMRGAGYSDDEIAMGLYLTGAILRQNGAGSTVELAR